MLNVQKLTSGYTLVHLDELASLIDVSKVQNWKNAKYVGEFTLKNKDGNWANIPVQIYYQKEAHTQGSNYFGLFFDGTTDSFLITDGISAVINKDGTPVIYTGVSNDDKEVLYSARRHDYQTYEGMMIDGGREYTKHNGKFPLINFKIVDGNIEIVLDTKEQN